MEDIFTIRFREELKSSHFNQKMLAEKVGISAQCISDYKSGKSFPALPTLRLLCKYLEADANYILGLIN